MQDPGFSNSLENSAAIGEQFGNLRLERGNLSLQRLDTRDVGRIARLIARGAIGHEIAQPSFHRDVGGP